VKEFSSAGKIRLPLKATICSVFTQDSQECARAIAVTLASPSWDALNVDKERLNRALLQHSWCNWNNLEGVPGHCLITPSSFCNAPLTQLVFVKVFFV